MIAATGPFPRSERIRRSKEFQAISRGGVRRRGAAFVVLSAPTRHTGGLARLGLTVSRRVGGAVVRNRLKRRIREWFRQVGRTEVRGRDLVVIARPGAGVLGSEAIYRELSRLAREAMRGASG